MDLTSGSQKSLRFGRVLGIIAIHEYLGYLILVGDVQQVRGGGASRRIATGAIVATVAVFIIAGAALRRPAPSAKVAAAGDIASCRTGADEATAELVEGIDGTVWPWAMRRTPRLGGELRGMLRAVVGTVQGAHQACPR